MATAERTAEVTWNGDLMQGSGQLSLASSNLLTDTPVSWPARAEAPGGKTSPEELLAAAHASCYAMAFSAALGRAGSPPEQLRVRATASLDRMEQGFKVTKMELSVEGRVPGLEQSRFEQIARDAEQSCPISNALRNNVDIQLQARLA